MKDIRATLKIFSTGSITITAPKVETVQTAVEEAYRLVYDYRNERRPDGLEHHPIAVRRKRRIRSASDEEEDNDSYSGRKRSRNQKTS